MSKKWNPEFVGKYPFVSKNIIPGEDVVVRSHSHRKQLMKEHGLQDASDWSTKSIKAKRRDFKEERLAKQKKDIEKIYKDVRGGKVDLRPQLLARKKAEYELRNYGRVLNR